MPRIFVSRLTEGAGSDEDLRTARMSKEADHIAQSVQDRGILSA
ncbi:hypothetical protein GGD61_008367 [Bradyrhizobium sp. SBR1B]|nr:hypothetical protein [Bradyrhizobium sp. SBR1B]